MRLFLPLISVFTFFSFDCQAKTIEEIKYEIDKEIMIIENLQQNLNDPSDVYAYYYLVGLKLGLIQSKSMME